ncbi:MAG: ABC transporter substrate-binding protein [Coriobacteriales bacterium]|jgi:NitT/TauT family transport system substrate-binding protein
MQETTTGKISNRHGVAKSVVALATILALCVLLVTGCSSQQGTGESSGSDGAVYSGKITIGTLATEDILPMWVAQEEGLFEKAGLDVDITTFQSATELIAGVSSGEVDFAMTDPMVAASIYASGTDVRMQWVTLGTTAEQGRFGIMTTPDSGITSLKDLAGVPIGVGSNTILEYVMDNLMEDEGVPEDQIVVEEMQKLPVRYQALASGEVKAVALPASLLALGEASGYITLADDTTGDNISQSVMIVRSDWLEQDGAEAARDALESVWDQAATEINASPESYRSILIENANLSDAVADTYEISEYPMCQMPTNEMVDPVLDWMTEKGYLTKPLSYDGQTGTFSEK